MKFQPVMKHNLLTSSLHDGEAVSERKIGVGKDLLILGEGLGVGGESLLETFLDKIPCLV